MLWFSACLLTVSLNIGAETNQRGRCAGRHDDSRKQQKFHLLPAYHYKYQLPLTNTRDVLHHGERAANNVDARCDKLATELSCQRFASKVAYFQLPHLQLSYSTCIWRLRFG